MPNARSDSFQKETQRVPGPTVKLERRVMSRAQRVASPGEHSLGNAVSSRPLAASPSGQVSEGAGETLRR